MSRRTSVALRLSLAVALLAPAALSAGTYWVSPTGAATWASAQSATPLSGSACATLASAISNVVAGDTVYLRGGSYSTGIVLIDKTGTSVSKIRFVAYEGETPIVSNSTNSYATYYYSLLLEGCDYVVIDGVRFEHSTGIYFFQINGGSDYNEIANCVFDGNSSGAAVAIWKGNVEAPDSDACTNNWIHHTTFEAIGKLSADGGGVDDTGGMQIGIYMGGYGFEQVSGYNTVEDCIFFGGGHHNLETFSKFNVIRRNFWRNYGSMTNDTGNTPAYGPDSNGKWGNRNVQIYDGAANARMFNLIEGNRFGPSGPSPDDDGGDGLTIAAPGNIIRRNTIYSAQNNGVLFKTGTDSFADDNRFYHNTVFNSGRFDNTGPQWQGHSFRWYGSYVRNNNVIVNNIFNSFGGSVEMNTNSGSNTIAGNFLTSDGDPLFVDDDVSNLDSATLPNLSVTAASPVIDDAVALTLANGAGSNTTTLVVDDALMFQDGAWGSSLSDVQADTIAVGAVGNVAQIASIDYATNSITLAAPLTWSDDASVWLVEDSSGSVVLYGSAPDIGAFEYESGADTTPPVISSVSVTPGTTTATVTWTTDEASSSLVDYGPTTGYGSTQTGSSGVTSHIVYLTGLSASTTYHFRVRSTDAASNEAVGTDGTFTTDPTGAGPTIQVRQAGRGSRVTVTP
jgi:hypothetical protein